jgi:small-conductance mechanosensitive channel
MGIAAVRFAVLAVVLIATSLASALPVRSADPASAKPKSETLETLMEMAPEAARDRLAGMTDREARAVLMKELDRKEVPPSPVSGMTEAADFFSAFNARAAKVIAEAPKLKTIGALIVERISGGKGLEHLWRVMGTAILVFAVGFAVETLFRRLLRAPPAAAPPDVPMTQGGKLSILFTRFLVDAAALAVFAASSFAVFLVTVASDDQAMALVLATLFWPLIITRAAAIVARFLLAPANPELRLPILDDTVAGVLFRRGVLLVGLYMFASYLYFFIASAPAMTPELDTLILSLLSLGVVMTMLIVVRRTWWVVAAIIGDDRETIRKPRRLLQLFVDRGYLAVAFTMIGAWAVNTANHVITVTKAGKPLSTTMVVLLSLPVIDWAMREMVAAALKVSHGWSEAEPKPRPDDDAATTSGDTGLTLAQRKDYHEIIVHNARLVITVITVFVLSKVWNVNLQTMAAASVGERLAEALFHIVAVLIVASAALGILRTAIRHAVPPERFEGIGSGEATGTGGTRAQTLVPLVGKFIMAAVVVVAVLLILADLGVDIGPLIAGAGVVGIAIGFGAQALIRDILSGLFFLADDAFRIGEYIDVGTVKGTVERISIRSMRLRHHRGQLNTIPYGEIKHLTNYSRDWAIMKLELRLPFDVDLEKVRKLIKKVGVELMDHPEYGQHFIQPVKSQGVNRLDDSALIVRVKFMTKPNEQWTIRREVFRRIQEVFAENDIHFAPRRVIVEDVSGQPVSPARMAAAGEAIAAEDEAARAPAKSAASSM